MLAQICGGASSKMLPIPRFHDSYYVVAQMGQKNSSYITYSSATDYMLETILYVYCLLFINTFYLAGHKKDVSRNIL